MVFKIFFVIAMQNTTTVLDKALQNGDEDIIALIRSVASEDDD